MAYQSLYRKYRPQTFADVMGQGHVVRTLQNAIASGRVAHGYLFTGTRGTAKTTIARLLAKALNCESQSHPVIEPCNQCSACRTITAGGSIDVIEMDAASHRGVADIEEVRKSVGYGPMELRYKVFIIDEAHQLSSDAKDAFLKTLEEPPDNVVFILATTEPQAIPITIRSRCQQFDFKRGSLSEIAARLRFVLEAEGVKYTPEAINLVARGAEGSYRDSLSLLEQVLAFAPKTITASDVVTVLGTLDTDSLSRVTEAVANRDAAATFALAGQLLDAGKEARTLLRTLAAHFRDLLLVRVGGPAVAAELTPEEVAQLQRQAQAFTAPQILKAVDILNEAQGETRWNNQHRLLVELAFLKLMTIGDAPDSPLPVAPIVFSAAPTADLMARPITLPEIFVAPPIYGHQTPAAVPPPPSLPTPVPPVTEEFRSGYFEDETASDDEYELDEGDDAPALLLATPDVNPSPVALSIDPIEVIEVSPEPSEPTLEAIPLFEESEGIATEPVDIGPGLFDDEPELVPPTALPTVAPVIASESVPEVAATPDIVAEQKTTEVVETPPIAEPISSGFGLFDEEEVGAGKPAPDPFRQGAQAEEEVEEVKESPGWYLGPDPGPAFDAESVVIGRPSLKSVLSPEPAIAVITEPEIEPEAPPIFEPDLFNIDDAYRAWPRFLMDARRLSKKTELMMSSAHPERVYRNTLEIVFPGRFQYDMMSTPKAQEFVRKLFARCLGVPKMSVKFVLSENAPPPPPRKERAKKQEFDPLAAIDALDSVTESSHVAAEPMIIPQYHPPVPAPSAPHFATAPRRPETVRSIANPPSFAPAGSFYEDRGPAKSEGVRDHPALDNPLVQDILEIFGGEIVSD